MTPDACCPLPDSDLRYSIRAVPVRNGIYTWAAEVLEGDTVVLHSPYYVSELEALRSATRRRDALENPAEEEGEGECPRH